jgi:hypothetical protein
VGEQLTNDYATLYMRPSEGFDCRCGAPSCRGAASDTAPLAVANVCEQLRHALDELGLVPQPLSGLLRSDWLERAQETLSQGQDTPLPTNIAIAE